MTKTNQHLRKGLLAEAEEAWHSAVLKRGGQVPASRLQELTYKTQTFQNTSCKLGTETTVL